MIMLGDAKLLIEKELTHGEIPVRSSGFVKSSKGNETDGNHTLNARSRII